jgi:hypothetical protein
MSRTQHGSKLRLPFPSKIQRFEMSELTPLPLKENPLHFSRVLKLMVASKK